MRWSDYLFSLLFIITVATAFFILIPAYTDYQNARSDVNELRRELRQRELEAHRLRQQINRLKNDPDKIERVARERLGWCREDEKVYHFEFAD